MSIQTKSMQANQKLIIVLILFFLAFISTHAQENLTQTIKGKVVDNQTKQPLLGVNVLLLNSDPKVGTTTDENGNFRLEGISIGRISLAFTYLGYEDFVVSEILVGSAKEIDLAINLVEAFGQLDEVVITSKKDPRNPNNTIATVSARSFSVEETKRFPASISDPGRMALSFAGVTNSDDETNEIIIRGNAPNQLLWRIEGLEVPEPNHFSEEGYSPGAISMLNNNMLGRSDFFTGAFPANYGNALSGVFDINLRNGNADKQEYAFQFGVLGADLTAEGPFNKNSKSSYLINYRYSTLSLLNNIIEISEDGIPTYQDVSFKINIPLSKKTNLSIWGIGGISEDNKDEVEEDGFLENETFESKTYMSGLTLSHFLNKGEKLDARVSFSGNESDFEFAKKEIQTNENEGDSDFLRNNALRISLEYTKKLSPKTTIKSGATLSSLQYDVTTKELINSNSNTVVAENGNATMFQTFALAKHRFTKEFSTSFGLHATSFSVNKIFVIEPRLGFEYKAHPKHTLSAGFGIHSRRMPLNQYFVKVGNNTPNTNLDLMKATHYVLGYDWRLIKKGHLKLEIYYQNLTDLAVVKNPLITDSYVNGLFLNNQLSDSGKGRNYGLEITFEKFFANQYYFLTTTSIYDSQYKASDNNWYNSNYNYNYVFNLVGGKEFTIKKKNILGLNGKIIHNGGKRGTPLDANIFNQTGETIINQSLRNEIQFDSYVRLDISASYRVNRPKVSHIFSLDIQNTTNQDNVDGQFFNQKTGELLTSTQLGIVPFVNYKIEF